MFRFSKQKIVQKEDLNVPAIHNQLEKNITYIKQLFSYGTNQGFSSREVIAKFSQKKVCLFFYCRQYKNTSSNHSTIYPSSDDTIFRRAIKKERLRPGYIKPKDLEKK